MEPKLLNLSEMLELHDILHHYVQKDYPTDSIEFIQSILEELKVEPVDYLRCISILTGMNINEMRKEDFMDYLIYFVQGLSLNKYIDFMDVSEKLGIN